MQLLALAAAASAGTGPEWLARLPRVLDAKDACPPFGLPGTIYSAPGESSGTDRHGTWQTHDGGTLASWAQTAGGESTGMDVTVMGRMYMHLSTSDLDPDQADPKHPGRETAVITAENCDGVPLFSLLERPGGDAPLELYVWTEEQEFRTEDFLAKGYRSQLDRRDFIWSDVGGLHVSGGDNTSLAQATERTPSLARDQKMADEDLNIFGGVHHFQLTFFDQALTNRTTVKDGKLVDASSEAAYLLDPHVRFVLAAATQLRALREADRGQSGTVRLMGDSRTLRTLERICRVVAFCCALLAVFAMLYQFINPRMPAYGHDGKIRGTQPVDFGGYCAVAVLVVAGCGLAFGDRQLLGVGLGLGALLFLLTVFAPPDDGKNMKLADRVKAWAQKFKKKGDPSQLQSPEMRVDPRSLREYLVDEESLRLRDGRTIMTVEGKHTTARADLETAMDTCRPVTITVGYDHKEPWSDAVDFGKGPGEPDLYDRDRDYSRAQGARPGPQPGGGAPFVDAYRPDMGYGSFEPTFVPKPDVRAHTPGPVRLHSD